MLISPGPGRPEDAGHRRTRSIERFAGRVPVLGVCLGHQCIGQVFGGDVVRAADGDARQDVARSTTTATGVFAGLPDPFEATRYHSLVVDRRSLPDVLEITAETDDGTVMGLRHRELAIEGVQFHPESILTTAATTCSRNFLAQVDRPVRRIVEAATRRRSAVPWS